MYGTYTLSSAKVQDLQKKNNMRFYGFESFTDCLYYRASAEVHLPKKARHNRQFCNPDHLVLLKLALIFSHSLKVQLSSVERNCQLKVMAKPVVKKKKAAAKKKSPTKKSTPTKKTKSLAKRKFHHLL